MQRSTKEKAAEEDEWKQGPQLQQPPKDRYSFEDEDDEDDIVVLNLPQRWALVRYIALIISMCKVMALRNFLTNTS